MVLPPLPVQVNGSSRYFYDYRLFRKTPLTDSNPSGHGDHSRLGPQVLLYNFLLLYTYESLVGTDRRLPLRKVRQRLPDTVIFTETPIIVRLTPVRPRRR